MNQKEKNEALGRVRSNLKIADQRHANCFKLRRNEGMRHRRRKYEIACYFVDKGYVVFTEAEFTKNRGNADVLVVGLYMDADAHIFEVHDSEKATNFQQKIDKYPYPVTFISAEGDFDEKQVT